MTYAVIAASCLSLLVSALTWPVEHTPEALEQDQVHTSLAPPVYPSLFVGPPRPHQYLDELDFAFTSPPPPVVTPAPPQPVPLSVAPPKAPVKPVEGEAAVRQALAQSSWPASLWAWVIRIARCESGFRANPPGGDGGKSLGLMQINTNAHPDLARRFDLRTLAGNLEAAWVVYTQRGGARAWSCK